MTTQKDVAKKADVSIATVSRYINKVGYISPEVQARIRTAIKELKYKPNLVARSLKLSSSQTIGLIFPDINNPFFIGLVQNAEEVAYNNGYNVVLCTTKNDLDRERTYIDALKGRLIDGYIVIPSSSDNERFYEILEGENVVFVDRSTGNNNEVLIKLDNTLGVRMAVGHLLELKHARIGIVNVPLNITTGYERFEGYKAAMVENGIELHTDLVKIADFSVESSYEKTREMLTLQNKPTAIVTMSGPTTIGALKAIKESGCRIPEDISLIGFDDFESSDLMDPPITTVVQPADEFGTKAAEVLVNLIKGQKPNQNTIVLKPKLIVRKSCRQL
ncbi:MAG: LacI family transcriptional regulator [Proteobacteria bacterium]|nr:LacI family transcriptional regulator [Pseudomonadota bacterium]